ncbi:hypothetical protein LTR91_007877 [Friedmanniomyces endolithicus]|uniref:FAM192A/Fyv6 N-terminal domain-containing protein n=1 Tax=Friedmanniomyces endolithicus TaxID=329885 RepID=A0A4U0UU44_9PEZI|nr:hypothetical protein LTS09_012515 [Friedmanniomyces endolithicus]KAK0273842.1 hypothetical protein LTR35_011968 [Friedmanniomyces endolithicus]KAK0279897.1 hypothetical protein LTS00_013277 [Friedmanniomyces endolithicus]KAK0310997.1 hypothetical protein LTR82_014446 [Friedmanniomyces endolithicus]KAK0926148.1 hypothetical protein LTR57_004399 [Friedmanniomyces endolithicus]
MSRFVSAGDDGQPPTERDEAWSKAQLQIEATKQQKAIASQQGSGPSLFDTLQANKGDPGCREAAKQEAFEEAARLRNQFRSLDEDEVDFLAAVSSASKTKEAEVKRETEEQLEAFRKQQEEAEKAAALDEDLEAPAPTEAWSGGSRKRKKGREKDGPGGLKVRRVSSVGKEDAVSRVSPPVPASKEQQASKHAEAMEEHVPEMKDPKRPVVSKEPTSAVPPKTTQPSVPTLGLGAYSSDEDS